MDIRWRSGRWVVLSLVIVTSALLASSPQDQPPGANAREDVEFLVDGVESAYDCDIILDSLVSRIDAATSHFTVMVRLDGDDCEEAFRALQLRSMAFPFSFMALPDSESESIGGESERRLK